MRAAIRQPNRRRLLQASAGFGLLGLGGCAINTAPIQVGLDGGPIPRLWPVRATTDRLFDITVCLRPFRAAGPRLEVEQIGDAMVVHNYGHGGSGWSLSWGSGTQAVRLAMAASPRRVAVIGCGAIGLTSAILAQEAGAQVTIYARELTPQARSFRATGSWTPDSRIALADKAAPGFAARWEEMARISFKRYRQYLGLPGDPVEWRDRYSVSDLSPAEQKARRQALRAGRAQPGPGADPRETLDFAGYEDRIDDLTPDSDDLPAGSTPFSQRYVRRTSNLQFNVADYAHTLLADFHAAGGRVVQREFHTPAEFATLDEKVVINCPGYGARALCKDESIVPVRGQIGWLIPQAEVTYGVYYKGVSMLSRRDGIVIQDVNGGDMRGYGVDDEAPDRAESEKGVKTIAELYSTFGRKAVA